jgi:hypothetical protein
MTTAAKKPHTTSPSQLETFKLCARKWWFFYVRKVKVPRGRQFMFGTVLHGACERFLEGKEMWPDGWDIDPDCGERVTPAEAALIQVLVQAGIDAGYVEKRPGGEVEQWMRIEWEDYLVRGLQDYRTATRVEDHKTSKSEKYMKSSAGLKKSLQMMVYAKERVGEFRKRGELPPPYITLVHNQFLKDFDNPKVRRREAEATPHEIDNFWDEEVVPLLVGMKKARLAENPFDIPDPQANACRAFGGCEMMGVCGGAEELLTFERRMSNLKTPTQKQQSMTSTSPSDFLNKRLGKAPAAASTATINPPAPPVKQAEAVVEAPTGDFIAPPWFSDKCPICSKGEFHGFNMKTGKPCRICHTLSKVTTEGYEWAVVDGTPIWNKEGEAPANGPAPGDSANGGSKTAYGASDLFDLMRKAASLDVCDEILLQSEDVGLTEVEADVMAGLYGERSAVLEVQNAAIARHNESKAAKEATAAETPEDAPDDAPDDVKKPRRKRRTKEEMAADAAAETAKNKSEATPAPETGPEEPSKSNATGLTLLIGCAPLKGMDVVFAEDVLRGINYWANTEVFARREGLRRAIEGQGELLVQLGNCTIVQQGRDPDIDNLMSALIPHATTVIRGTIQ